MLPTYAMGFDGYQISLFRPSTVHDSTHSPSLTTQPLCVIEILSFVFSFLIDDGLVNIN
jgi:hypothetical protein